MLSASKVFLLSILNAVPQSETALVGARGFEPPTSRTRTVRATKLRYAPTNCNAQHSSLPKGRDDASRATGSAAGVTKTYA